MQPISPLIDRLRSDLAVLRLAERGTDAGWIDDESVAVARQAVLRSARKFIESHDAAALGASRPSPADDEIAVGQVWSAPDGRQLRVAGLSESQARIAMRNVESNRLTYMDRSNFDASQKWHLTRVGPSPADRQEEQ